MMLRILLRFYSKDLFLSKLTRLEKFDKEFLIQTQFNKHNLEKISVECETFKEKVTLTMYKNISTPMDCAIQINKLLARRSVLANVDNQVYDMNRPLTKDCFVTFTNFKSYNPSFANIAFWRSCSFLTNYALENFFDKRFQINICSFPSPNIGSGSFVTDVQVLMDGDVSFDPSLIKSINLKTLTKSLRRLITIPYNFQPLSISPEVALDMFHYCPLKVKQVPLIAERNRLLHGHDRIHVYKVGQFVDICQGPLIPSTSYLGMFQLTAMYPIETQDYGRLYRVQGVALPYQIETLKSSFEVLAKRASVPNKFASMPQLKSLTTKKKSMTSERDGSEEEDRDTVKEGSRGP